MNTTTMPARTEMLDAFMRRDPAFDGIFVTAVITTGIFCRPTCPARKPKPSNVEFYPSSRDALVAGYRPCRRCRPMRADGDPPEWLAPLVEQVEERPARRWRDRDLRDMGLEPARVRRWFQRHHGMTFHAYSRARRLGTAIGHIREGDQVSRTAYAAGYESLSGFTEALRKLSGQAPSKLQDAEVIVATRIPTPLGPMVAGAIEDRIALLEFADRRGLPTQFDRVTRALGAVLVPGEVPILSELAARLAAYFDGNAADFDVPLETRGTPFQETVWAALREIPRGTVASYLDVAKAIGRPTATRAVARANGDNRIAILIPCHRVIGSDGSLTGYGGGLWRKRRLLELEGMHGDASGRYALDYPETHWKGTSDA